MHGALITFASSAPRQVFTTLLPLRPRRDSNWRQR